MKNLSKASAAMLLIFAALIMVASSCRKIEGPEPPGPGPDVYAFELRPEGSFGGTMMKSGVTEEPNLIIDAPAGAVSEPVTLIVKLGPSENPNGFILKTVEIMPKSLVYNVPIKLSFKYNGALLSNGTSPGSGILELYCFPNVRAYDEWEIDKCDPMCEGTVNLMEETIEAFICNNGIFAILERSDYGQ